MIAKSLIPLDRVQGAILPLRGRSVILDADLASLYDVETKTLLRAVHRNLDRFPADALEQKYDGQFQTVFKAFRELMEPLAVRMRPIGY